MHSTASLSLCRELVERCLPETPRSTRGATAPSIMLQKIQYLVMLRGRDRAGTLPGVEQRTQRNERVQPVAGRGQHLTRALLAVDQDDHVAHAQAGAFEFA